MTRLRVLLAVALALALAPVAAVAQAGTVRGRVVEQGSNNPLQGVSVSVVGGGSTTLTNQEGRFTLGNVPAGARTLRAARIGYGAQTRTVTVGAEPVEVNFALGTDVLGLDEIVVIGYGQVERRRAGGGAISSIRPTAVTESAPTPTVENVLQGRVAGVQVVQNSGVPGSAISVRVRGASSITAGNEPLYVIDGVPLIQGNFSTIQGAIGQTQGIDALSDLNPNEIESIEVLKVPWLRGTPSITDSGSLPAVMAEAPRTRTEMAEPGTPEFCTTCTPATRPCSTFSTVAVGALSVTSLGRMEEMAPPPARRRSTWP